MFSKTSSLFALVCLTFFTPVLHVDGYDFLNPLSVWPDGQVRMDLKLGSPGVLLIDGNTSWNDVAEGALATWNSYINTVDFAVYTLSQGPAADADHVNQVFFSSTVYGQAFGSGVLAVTTRWYNGTRRSEGDTIFNIAKSWNSYRGNLRIAAGGGTLNDLRRVALHEFGHTLGLDHPDQAGQFEYALMNSTIGNLDGLTLDDVEGAQALYYRLAPTISGQPQSADVSVGGSVTFSVVASGIPAPKYQWYWKGVLQQGVTNASVTYSGVQPSYAGAFHVVVSNSRGSATSAQAVLRVLYPPAITVQPQSKIAVVGQRVDFNVSATGVPLPDYQWHLNGVPIPGAVGATYTIFAVQNSDSGDYSVSVSNSQGNAPSGIATLQVYPVPLSLSALPATQIVFAKTNFSLAVDVVSAGAFSCQWLRNGKKIRGQTSPTLSLPNISISARGSYQLEVRNSFAVAQTTPVQITVVVPPSIVSQPRAVIANSGRKAIFRVSAKGSKPLTFQWLKDGIPILGATSKVFSILHAQPTDAGTYSARVTNLGDVRESISAQLTVLP